MRISDWSSDVCSSDLEDRVAAAQRLGDVADAARRQRHHVALGDQDGGAIAFEADGFAAAGVHVGSWACGVAVRRVAFARTAGTPRMVAARRLARTPLYRCADGMLSGFRTDACRCPPISIGEVWGSERVVH